MSQILVFNTLKKSKKMTTIELSKKLNMPISNIYNYLQRLKIKGLVTFDNTYPRKYYLKNK